jgi:hypothetical protein
MRARQLAAFLAIPALLVATACGGTTYPTLGLQIRTDSPSYDFARSEGPRVEVTVINASAESVRLASCHGHLTHMMEQATDGRWMDATRQGCQLIPSYEAIDLAPGDSIRTWVNPIAVGRYRVRIGAYRDPRSVRFSSESSATFEVR